MIGGAKPSRCLQTTVPREPGWPAVPSGPLMEPGRFHFERTRSTRSANGDSAGTGIEREDEDDLSAVSRRPAVGAPSAPTTRCGARPY